MAPLRHFICAEGIFPLTGLQAATSPMTFLTSVMLEKMFLQLAKQKPKEREKLLLEALHHSSGVLQMCICAVQFGFFLIQGGWDEAVDSSTLQLLLVAFQCLTFKITHLSEQWSRIEVNETSSTDWWYFCFGGMNTF